jgi:hypothetical protein
MLVLIRHAGDPAQRHGNRAFQAMPGDSDRSAGVFRLSDFSYTGTALSATDNRPGATEHNLIPFHRRSAAISLGLAKVRAV